MKKYTTQTTVPGSAIASTTACVRRDAASSFGNNKGSLNYRKGMGGWIFGGNEKEVAGCLFWVFIIGLAIGLLVKCS